MATLASAFYSQHVGGADLNYVLSNLPHRGDFNFNEIDSRNGHPDSLHGTNKPDLFYTQPGDTASGGKGYDAVFENPDGSGHLADLQLGGGVEFGLLGGSAAADITGNSKDNVLVGNDGANSLFGKDGDDTLIGNAGNDLLKGSDGKDILSGDAGDDRLVGGADRDLLDGGDGNDHLSGGGGKDLVFGFGGDDKLFGGDKGDSILGGAGNDTIFGDRGTDHLTGGDGNDVFGIEKGDNGTDVINDFQPGVDKIDLSDFNTSFNKLHLKNHGDDVIISVGKGKHEVSFKLLGFQKDDVHDFSSNSNAGRHPSVTVSLMGVA